MYSSPAHPSLGVQQQGESAVQRGIGREQDQLCYELNILQRKREGERESDIQNNDAVAL